MLGPDNLHARLQQPLHTHLKDINIVHGVQPFIILTLGRGLCRQGINMCAYTHTSLSSILDLNWMMGRRLAKSLAVFAKYAGTFEGGPGSSLVGNQPTAYDNAPFRWLA
eukprot:1161905-Pelagomonas_calceolata.AAC.2